MGFTLNIIKKFDFSEIRIQCILNVLKLWYKISKPPILVVLYEVFWGGLL